MTIMSRNTPLQSFSVSQPSIGAPLQFVPALGTRELDDLIHAYIPGSASIQEKRAIISMDFFEYSQTTGATMRFYSLPASRPISPASASFNASPMQDSGYGSQFVSPVISDWSWPQVATPASAAASTPSSFSSFAHESLPQQTRTSKGKASSSASRKTATSTTRVSVGKSTDFSHMPGMKIMTRDGRDVTNSASRGCKTKEQRDHAHLMRIIKACDACRKKKIRCDPSHKKPRASVPSTASPASTRTKPSSPSTSPSKKARIASASTPSVPSLFPDDMALEASTDFATDPAAFVEFEMPDFVDNHDQALWDSFIQCGDEIVDEYGFFFDPAGHFSPDSAMPASPSQSSPAPASCSAVDQHAGLAQERRAPNRASALAVANAASLSNVPGPEAPTLPYLAHAEPGSNYVDFNLFSPASSFLDDDSLPVTDIGTAALYASAVAEANTGSYCAQRPSSPDLVPPLPADQPTNSMRQTPSLPMSRMETIGDPSHSLEDNRRSRNILAWQTSVMVDGSECRQVPLGESSWNFTDMTETRLAASYQASSTQSEAARDMRKQAAARAMQWHGITDADEHHEYTSVSTPPTMSQLAAHFQSSHAQSSSEGRLTAVPTATNDGSIPAGRGEECAALGHRTGQQNLLTTCLVQPGHATEHSSVATKSTTLVAASDRQTPAGLHAPHRATDGVNQSCSFWPYHGTTSCHGPPSSSNDGRKSVSQTASVSEDVTCGPQTSQRAPLGTSGPDDAAFQFTENESPTLSQTLSHATRAITTVLALGMLASSLSSHVGAQLVRLAFGFLAAASMQAIAGPAATLGGWNATSARNSVLKFGQHRKGRLEQANSRPCHRTLSTSFPVAERLVNSRFAALAR